jgi:hypothetical protein
MVNSDNTLRFYVLEMQHDSYSVYNHNTDKEIYFDADLETVLSFLKLNDPTHPMYAQSVLEEESTIEQAFTDSITYMPTDENGDSYYLKISEDEYFNWSSTITDPNQTEFSFVVGSDIIKEKSPDPEELKELPEDE